MLQTNTSKSSKSRFSVLWASLGAAIIGLLISPFFLAEAVWAASPPGAVSNITASRGNGTLTASWTAGSEATSYHVVYSSDNKASWTAAAVAHTSTSITINGLDNLKDYVIGVRSKNSSGGSAWVNSALIKSQRAGAVSNISVARTANSMNVSWTAGDNATSYHIVYSSDDKVSWTAVAINHSSTSLTIDSINGTATYIIGVRAKNNIGASHWVHSIPIVAAGQAGPVTDISATRIKQNSAITLTWTAGNNATGYQYRYSTDNGQNWTNTSSTISSTSLTMSFLDDTKTYIYGVRSVNGSNYSPWRYSSPVKPFPPASPTAVYSQINGRGDGTLAIYWKHDQTGSGTVTYDVVYSSDGRESWTRAATNLSPANCTPSQSNYHLDNSNNYCYTITGLDNQTDYIVGVRAKANTVYSNWYNSGLLRAITIPFIMDVEQRACPGSSNYVLYNPNLVINTS